MKKIDKTQIMNSKILTIAQLAGYFDKTWRGMIKIINNVRIKIHTLPRGSGKRNSVFILGKDIRNLKAYMEERERIKEKRRYLLATKGYVDETELFGDEPQDDSSGAKGI